MNRRSLLCSFSIPVVTSVGGCLGFGSMGSGSVTLGAVLLENHDPDSSHRFDVRVKQGGKTVHSGSYTVQSPPAASISTRFVDCSWEEREGNYSIVARVDDGTWGEYNILDGVDDETDCAVGSVQRRHGMDEDAPPELDAFAICDQLDATETEGSPCSHNQTDSNA